MKGLGARLIAVYLAATAVPLALTVWTSIRLLNLSLDLRPLGELDALSRSFERVGREYYQRSKDALETEARAGRIEPQRWSAESRPTWPAEVLDFYESGNEERFETAGPDGKSLRYYRRDASGVRVYRQDLAIGRAEFTRQFSAAREAVARASGRDLRRGFVYTFVAVVSSVWIAGMLAMAYFARRLTAPVRALTSAINAVGQGDLDARVTEAPDNDEIGAAIRAFHRTTDQLRESRERLIHVTRLESWQALARKTAHEVKNSLTPIRLTLEEMTARVSGPDAEYLRQASQIAVDEVTSLERRVRAFSEFAAEPPLSLVDVDLSAVAEERVSMQSAAHPEVSFRVAAEPGVVARADSDLIRGVVTNLVKNAAEAAGAGGNVLVRVAKNGGKPTLEVHDSGPGLTEMARRSLFEPAISFKKGGMGLGLSIARKSVLACGGAIETVAGELGGAGFRVILGTRNGQGSAN